MAMVDFLAPKQAKEHRPKTGIDEEVDQRVENWMEVVHDVGVVVYVRAECHAAILAQVHEYESRKPAKQEHHCDDGTHDNDASVAPSVVALLSLVVCRLFRR